MAATRQIQFGLMLETPGASFNAWLHPTTPSDASVNFQAARTLVELAEQANFLFAFVADNVSTDVDARPHYLNRFEPVAFLSALASVTSRIGLIATISTTYSEPYNIARQIGTLDHISGGRAGWNVVTTALDSSAANFGSPSLLDHDERYASAEEFIDVVHGLWDSWDDDAFPRNRQTRQFADFSKLHELNHEGRYFKVKGPLNLSRPPQGYPVTFQAGSSSAGRDFAARYAEGIFTRTYDFESSQEFYRDMKARAAKFGRNPDELKIYKGIQTIVAETEAEADEKYETILSYTSDRDAIKYLGNFYNHMDFSKYDPDAPFPNLTEAGGQYHRGFTATFDADARRLGLTLREVARRVACQKEDFFGTPHQVADAMERYFMGEAADGFLVSNWVQPEGLRDFTRLVIPELQRRGLYPRGYTGGTLRQNMGLQRPKSRYHR